MDDQGEEAPCEIVIDQKQDSTSKQRTKRKKRKNKTERASGIIGGAQQPEVSHSKSDVKQTKTSEGPSRTRDGHDNKRDVSAKLKDSGELDLKTSGIGRRKKPLDNNATYLYTPPHKREEQQMLPSGVRRAKKKQTVSSRLTAPPSSTCAANKPADAGAGTTSRVAVEDAAVNRSSQRLPQSPIQAPTLPPDREAVKARKADRLVMVAKDSDSEIEPMSQQRHKPADQNVVAKKANKSAKALHMDKQMTSQQQRQPLVASIQMLQQNVASCKGPVITLDPAEVLDETKPSAEVLEKLEKEGLFPLKKKSMRFPRARYYCRLCEYHCDSVQISMKHIKEARHQRHSKWKHDEYFLKHLPAACDIHLSSLDTVLLRTAAEKALRTAGWARTQAVLAHVRSVVHAEMSGLQCNLYGTAASGFGLETCDVNINIRVPDEKEAPTCLIKALDVLQKSDVFRDVRSHFSSRVPRVLFVDAELGLSGSVSATCEAAALTSQLLEVYSRIDPRCKQLGVLFQNWARVCGVDKQDLGTLPPHAYSIMTVYFLQQLQPPVLPVLHEMPYEKTDNEENYPDFLSDPAIVAKTWKTENNMGLGQLWLDLLRFYAVDFEITEYVVCIRELEMLSRKGRRWSQRRLSIEDP
ncbi:PREDICTED: terminal uridylyltransferase 4-like, partial [Priapulus caudatus]|uniref:Terminal uridylyltransferase 4-like n=1 Tax=Priapulus caudatus TaxID=37621 RepID=A0ABM1DXV4_PRICU